MKRIALLGSTGSIGTQTLDIVRKNPDFVIKALGAGSNIELIEKQAREFRPEKVCLYDEKCARMLSSKLKDTNIKVLSGMEGLIEIATMENVDVVLTAVVGMIGIRPTIAAIECHKDIALANKETLVTAGHIIMPLAKKMGVNIYPVDSEHSAIFQSLNGENHERINKIILTASGGPFRGKKRAELENVTLEDALKHPNWSMGKKITIDSATMVNKGLEVIEARWLFDVDFEKISVVIQPQSIIHSMVEYVDGGIIAQLGMPDMKLPIQYALTYPDRWPMDTPKFDFKRIMGISFEEPDIDTFKGLGMAYEAGKTGGTMPAVFNAANEKAVALFLNNKIKFINIDEIIKDVMENHKVTENPSVEEILNAEAWVYEYIHKKYNKV